MKKQIHWAILGLEFIAADFASKLNQKNGIYALYSKDKAEGIKFSKQHRIDTLYNNMEAMLEDETIDIVYISTLGHEHFENIMSCLRHGKHVFCEKAMFTCLEDAEQAFTYAKEQNLLLAEANTIFYMPLYEEIRTRIADIGKLKMLRAEFGSLKEEDKNTPLFQSDKGGGALLDIGIYALSVVCSFLDCNQAEIVSFHKEHSFGVDEQWCICLKSGQALASINLDIRCKLPKRLLIVGDKAYFEIYNYPRCDSADLVYPDGQRVVITCGREQDAVAYEIEKIEKLLHDTDTSNETMQITLAAMAIMEELRMKKAGNDYD